MSLRLREVKESGNIKNERVIIDVTDNDNTNHYMIMDNTFDEEGDISNKWRHVYKFTDQPVVNGDVVVLHSRKGVNGNQEIREGKNKQYNFFGISQNQFGMLGNMQFPSTQLLTAFRKIILLFCKGV